MSNLDADDAKTMLFNKHTFNAGQVGKTNYEKDLKMASRRSIKRVPTFTDYQIVLADLCARDLWEGTNFENGKDMEISDERGCK